MDMGLIMQVLAQARARKMRQAETALGLVAPGATFKELNPELQKQVMKATGRKYLPDEVVSPMPISQDEASLKSLMKGLGIAPNSTLGMGLLGAQASKIATGKPSDIATPGQMAVTQEAAAAKGRAGLVTARGEEARAPLEQQTLATKGKTELSKAKLEEEMMPTVAEAVKTKGRTEVSEARAGETMARSYESALAKLKAGTGTSEFTPDELAAFKKANDFVPSEAIASQLEGQTRSEVMKHALKIVGDPNSSGLTKIMAPFGVSPADAIGGIALGMGSMLETAISRKAAIDVAKIEAQVDAGKEARKARLDVSTTVSKGMGGVDPLFVEQVLAGNPKAINTDLGRAVLKYANSGFHVAMVDQAQKGNPTAALNTKLLEIARVPGVANHPELLEGYSNLVRKGFLTGLVDTYAGYERPKEPGKAQKNWDARMVEMDKKMGGVFSTDAISAWLPGGDTGTEISAPGAEPEPEKLPAAAAQKKKDTSIIQETMDAIFGAVGPGGGTK